MSLYPSYRNRYSKPINHELFDKNGKFNQRYTKFIPKGNSRISANPHTNGGVLLKDLILPNCSDYGVKIQNRGSVKAQDMLELGGYIRDVFTLNEKNKNFRIFCPDEAMSNRLYKAFEVENRSFMCQIFNNDEALSADGRIMDSFLSEHMCEGWLEGYLLTGRHGFFASYEAFIRVVDSILLMIKIKLIFYKLAGCIKILL